MRKFISMTCILLATIGLIACSIGDNNSNKTEQPDIEGYILDKYAQSIFVVSKEAEDLSADDGIDEFYDAISLRDAPDNLEIGQLVKVWYDGAVEESYPAGGKVGELEVIKVDQPEGAILKETEALKKALETEHRAGT